MTTTTRPMMARGTATTETGAISATTGTLLDEAIPAFDFGNGHGRHVHASPERVTDAVEAFRLQGPGDLLFRLRGIRLPSGSIRDVLPRSGFTLLAERPGREVVAGTFGQFWAIRELTHMEAPRDMHAFRAFNRPGWAKGAISIRIDPLADGSSYLSTETRVRCSDAAARRRFAAYWALIRVFSGWLRRDLLRRIARAAEASA